MDCILDYQRRLANIRRQVLTTPPGHGLCSPPDHTAVFDAIGEAYMRYYEWKAMEKRRDISGGRKEVARLRLLDAFAKCERALEKYELLAQRG